MYTGTMIQDLIATVERAEYRTLESNTASVALARSLGFQEYAVTIAVRFREIFE